MTATEPTVAELEASWAARVRANREQVDRVREVPDGKDFYAPVTSLFRADPRRVDDPVLQAVRDLVVPGETWLDIGAGAGRYALPLGLIAEEVIAVDPSSGMLRALRELMAEYDVPNIRVLDGRWPPDADLAGTLGAFPCADVALIAHVGYDIEQIGPFVDAMEAAVRRLCVGVFMERQPAALADPFWPLVHGEARIGLPALPEFIALLNALGRRPEVKIVEQEARTFESCAELGRFLRRQLWIADGGEKERRFFAALDELCVEADGGHRIRNQPQLPIGVVTWRPDGVRGA